MLKTSSVVSRLFSCLLVAASSLPTALASERTETVQCTVSSVHDGDSMRVRCPGERKTIAVRMNQIDAPELDQAHGREARDRLRRLCPKGSTATIRTQGRDQYGRLLGDVYCGELSVNEEMVGAGAAWPYDRYVEDRNLFRLRDVAKSNRRGLWAGTDPQAPWRWRYQQRQLEQRSR